VFGYPFIDRATLQLPGNKALLIRVKKTGGKGTGIATVTLRRKRIPVTAITHEQLLKGGKLVFHVYP